MQLQQCMERALGFLRAAGPVERHVGAVPMRLGGMQQRDLGHGGAAMADRLARPAEVRDLTGNGRDFVRDVAGAGGVVVTTPPAKARGLLPDLHRKECSPTPAFF